MSEDVKSDAIAEAGSPQPKESGRVRRLLNHLKQSIYFLLHIPSFYNGIEKDRADISAAVQSLMSSDREVARVVNDIIQAHNELTNRLHFYEMRVPHMSAQWKIYKQKQEVASRSEKAREQLASEPTKEAPAMEEPDRHGEMEVMG